MNRATLIGNIGSEIEVINLESGKKLAKFSLATNRSYTNASGEKVQETEWHNITVWGKLADIVEGHFEKGKKYLVEGEIKTRSYENQSGEKRYTTEINMSNFEFL